MDTCSSYFNHPLALELDDKHFKMYGTRDLDTIELIKEFNDKNAEEIANKLADEKAEAKFNIIKEEFKLATIKEANEAYLVKKGNSISTLSPFITEYVDVNGQRLFRQDFIRDKIKRDPLYSERQLVKNAYNGNWQRMFKTKGPEFVSDVDVVAGFIVNVLAFGNSAPLVVYIKGRDNPLHFKNGNLSTHNIMKELQLEDKSFDGKWVAEAFKRSLCMCQNIWFLSIPEHMGGYKLPDGSLTYVSSSSVIPGLEAYFSPEIKTHVLITHEHSFEEVTEDYNLALPKSWKIKTLVVDRVSCILLPFFEEESLRPDRARIVSYVGEKEKHGIIALTKRVNYQSTVVKSLLDRRTNVKEDLSTMNDLPIIYSFSSTIENRGITDNKFNDIRLSLLGEDGIEFPTRNIVTILSETPASIPDNLPAYHLSVDENIDFGDVSMLQQMTGAFDFSIIQFLYTNQDAARSIVCKAIEKAHISSRMIRDAEITQSMIIFLATAHILKKISIITESELVSMIKWFSDKATSRACVSDKLVYDISIAINKEICSGKLKLSKQYEPPYFKNDGKTAFIADNDGSVNVDDETFEAVFLANIKSTDRRNLILKALKEKRKLISTKSYKRDLKVKFDDGLVEYISVYSFSPSILSNEAKEIVNKMLITDRFLQHQSCPDNFCSYIVHKRYNAVAGQVIKNYNNINPFTAVCGSPGSGKTDLLMMQSLQRAKAGDTVIILDSTNSFCEYEWGQHKVPKEIVDEMIVFWDMSTKGWLVDIIDFSDCHNIQQKREQLFSLLMSGSHLTGFNQISILLNTVDKMIKQLENGETNLYRCIINSFELKSEDRKVMNRVLSMFSTIAIESPHNMSWEKLLEMNGRIIVVSTGNATVKADVNPLDVILDSFYSYKDSHREGNVTLVLDEIQTMNLNEGAPIDTVLSKGRKLNISAFLASQRYSKGKDRLGRAFDYCDTKLFYRPMESCIEAVSEKTHIPTDVLRCLDQGECVFVGTAYSKHFGKNIPLRSALIGRTLRPPYVGSYNNGEQ